MHWGMTLRKCNRLLFDGNTFQFHNCEICEISFFSAIQNQMLKLGDSIKICVSCALSYWSNVWHDLPSGTEEAILDAHLSHIFYETENVTFSMKGQITYFFMNSKILHFFPTIHFVTAWASGTFPLTYTLKDMSVQQVFPFGTEIYSDQSSPIGCYS